MSKRQHITADALRSLSEDGYCQKCGLYPGEAHHIHALADGGLDSASNLVMLCTMCHKEWHALMERNVPFKAWLALPPAVVLVRGIIAAQQAPRTPIGEWLEALQHSLIVAALERRPVPPAPSKPIAWYRWQSGKYRWTKVHLVNEQGRPLCGCPIPISSAPITTREGGAAYQDAEPCHLCHKYANITPQAR